VLALRANSSGHAVRTDGTQSSYATSGTSVADANTVIGARNNTTANNHTGYFNGKIYATVAMRGEGSLDEIHRLEAWAAHLVGANGSLATDNPYRLTPPMTSTGGFRTRTREWRER
jgi:hypothetical protein